ncbi:unnamed protein product [Ilex paraguariensis]|uniref:Uncharacterized protein n=1 Tax=Ilex paraguariensis TaxID=185542 RepID=A0ABC8SQ20_9AQUA
MAFDIASIKLKGFDAMTNFDLKLYDVKGILAGNNVQVDLKIAKLLKEATALGPSNNKGGSSSDELSGGDKKESLLIEEDEIGSQMVSGLRAIHDNSPFKEMLPLKASTALNEPSTSNFHLATNVFQCKPANADESCIMQNGTVARLSYSLQFPDTDSIGEQKARAQGTGFRHSTSSCFKPYSKRQN